MITESHSYNGWGNVSLSVSPSDVFPLRTPSFPHRPSPITGHTAPPAQPQIHHSQAIDGALQGVAEHGAWEAVDDWVQGAVHVGEPNGEAEELADHNVGLTVRGTVHFDCNSGQPSGDPRQEAENEYGDDDIHHADGPPHLLLPVHLAVAEAAGDPDRAENQEQQGQEELQNEHHVVQLDPWRSDFVGAEAPTQKLITVLSEQVSGQ